MNSLRKEAIVLVMNVWHEERPRAEPRLPLQSVPSDDNDSLWHWLELLAHYFTHIVLVTLWPGPANNTAAP